VGARCDACTEVLGAGLLLEALASRWKETAGLRAATIAILFVPSPLVQNTSLLEAILWALFHISPLRQASLQLCFFLFGFHLGKLKITKRRITANTDLYCHPKTQIN